MLACSLRRMHDLIHTPARNRRVQRILTLQEGGGGVGAAPLAATVTVVVQVGCSPFSI